MFIFYYQQIKPYSKSDVNTDTVLKFELYFVQIML